MNRRKKPRKSAAIVRKGPLRQRQRLIDACISALHIYGPSRTTVGKVVSFAKLSPGIVRFYFDSKAAMLVASLQYLASEFEQQVLIPVGNLKSSPVAALQLMVDVFLDADFASPRKVSAWYTFWGEASSRQEYYDICGQKDESFAHLVHELVAALIVDTRQPQLDADAVALGLIGVLEILWQDIAFRTERDIDRPAARRRAMAYLRSIFPSRFASAPAARTMQPQRLGSYAYADAALFAQERERLFSAAWMVVGHETQLPHPGDFMAVDIGTERALVLRDAAGGLRALRNSCPDAPHAVRTERVGRLTSFIDCKAHGAKFSLDGRRVAGAGRGDLSPLELESVNGLVFVRSRAPAADMAGHPQQWFDTPPPSGLLPQPPLQTMVLANWKLLVEQWLEQAALDPASAARGSPEWHVPLAGNAAWSAARYRHLMRGHPTGDWRRQFLPPHQLLETRPDGLSVIQAWPIAPGRCVLRRLDYSLLPSAQGARAALYLVRRLDAYARREAIDMAESIQRGMTEFGYEPDVDRPMASALDWFQKYLAARVPLLKSLY